MAASLCVNTYSQDYVLLTKLTTKYGGSKHKLLTIAPKMQKVVDEWWVSGVSVEKNVLLGFLSVL